MSSELIHFIANEPQVLSLKDPVGVIDGFNVLYETTDEKTLQLPRPAAVKLNELETRPGEEFTATKHRHGNGPAEWVFALTPRSEQIRAAEEIAAAERTAREQAEATRRDLAGQLAASTQPGKLRKMPNAPKQTPQEPPADLKATGTYGPLPQVALASRKLKETVPFDVAFSEVTQFVTRGLKDCGEQWNDQAKQDAICSILISASRQGLLGLWNRGERV